MKKIFVVFISLFLLSSTFLICIDATETYNPIDGGWLEEREGFTILHVSGTYYEMGYQHGYLLKEEIQANVRMLIDFFDQVGFNYETLLNYWNIMKDYVPDNYMMEIEGMSEGSNISLEEIGILNILHDTANLIHCCGALLWDDATSDNSLIHVRSGDLRMNIFDPISDTYLQENQVIIVHKPDEGYASMSPIWSGGIGSYGGINEKGISVSETTCKTSDTTLNGTCASFRMGAVLDTAYTASEALNIMDMNRTCGWDLFIADAKQPVGYVLEQTANLSHVCTWDDIEESNNPFWEIEKVLRRGNCFVSKECASTQRERYDPSGILGLFDYVTMKNSYFLIWNHYKALSKGIEKYWGNLDLNSTMNMLREVYSGKTDMIYNLLSIFIFPPQPIQQWVACPLSGDMLFSFANPTEIASECPVYRVNLFELLNSKSP